MPVFRGLELRIEFADQYPVAIAGESAENSA
jgi:hypothetical protein